VCFFRIWTTDEELGLHSLSLLDTQIAEVLQCCTAMPAKCSTKPNSKLSIFIVRVVWTRLQRYCDISYSTGIMNQTWILKYSGASAFFWTPGFNGVVHFVQLPVFSSVLWCPLSFPCKTMFLFTRICLVWGFMFYFYLYLFTY